MNNTDLVAAFSTMIKTCYRHNVPVYCGPSSYPAQPDLFYYNNGNGTFTNLTEQSGLLSVSLAHGLGVAIADSDNDGDLDIYVANDQDFNFLFENLGDGSFEEIGLLSSVSCSDMGKAEAGMGVAFSDYDNDGDIDILIPYWNQTVDLLRNDGGNRNNWIQIQAIGTESNPSTIRAQIKVVTGELTQYAEVKSSGSYLAFSDLRVHFELKDAENVELLEIPLAK